MFNPSRAHWVCLTQAGGGDSIAYLQNGKSSESEPERPSLSFKQKPSVIPGTTEVEGAAVVDKLLLKVFHFVSSTYTPRGDVCRSQISPSTGRVAAGSVEIEGGMRSTNRQQGCSCPSFLLRNV